MNFFITHNEGRIEVHVHSATCPRTKGQAKWLYSYMGKVEGNTWGEVVKASANGFEGVGRWVYIVPDKCMINSFPDAAKVKFNFNKEVPA